MATPEQLNIRTVHMDLIDEGVARSGSDKTKWVNAAIELKHAIDKLVGKAATAEGLSTLEYVQQAILSKMQKDDISAELELAQADAAHDRVVLNRLVKMVAVTTAQVGLLVAGSAIEEQRRKDALTAANSKVIELYGPARQAMIDEYAQLLKEQSE